MCTLTCWGICLFFLPGKMFGQCDSLAIETELILQVCQGDSAIYNGTSIASGELQSFLFTTAEGCDSVVHVSANTISIDTGYLTLLACPGGNVFFQGAYLPVDTSVWSTFMSTSGCDSIVLVNVEAVQLDTGLIEFAACQGDSIYYGGFSILAGESQIITIPNSDGCDSTLMVSVHIIPADTSYVQLEVCATGTIDYEGFTLSAGDAMWIELENQFGCDSFVFVAVELIELGTGLLELSACKGESVHFDGFDILAGESQLVPIYYSAGCDSNVLVTVAILPSDTTFIKLETCKNESIDYQSFTLAAGDEMIMELKNQHGCDSIVYVSAVSLPDITFETATTKTCPETAEGEIEINITSGVAPFLCALENNPFQSIDVFKYLKSGNYNVQVMDGNGCVEKEEVHVAEREKLEVLIDDYEMPCGGPALTIRPILLNHAGEVTWQWPDGSDKDWMLAHGVGTYYFTIADECSKEERSVEITWDSDRPEEPFFVPNAFSPNNDGINDFFEVYLADGATFLSYELRVFDRWGAELFYTNTTSYSWDGSYQLGPMNPGVYAWFLQAKVELCGQVESLFREGDLTLIR